MDKFDSEKKTLIWERLQKIFQQVFEDPHFTITEQMSAKDVSNWDSLTHIQLILAVEKEFQIKIPLGELEAMQNIGDLFKTICEKT